MLEATATIDPAKPDRITLISDFRCKDVIKAIPGAKWDTGTRHWTLPLTWPSCLALRADFGKGLAIDAPLRTWAQDLSAKKKRLTALRPMIEPDDDMAIPSHLPGFADLYPFQVVDGFAIDEADGCYLLMNETGAGKSRSSLAGLSLIEARTGGVFPLAIVAPKSMLITWSREVQGFFPGKDVRICQGTPTKMRKELDPGADVYIIGWESLRKYSRLAGFGSIALSAEEKTDKELQRLDLRSAIFDECHRAQNPQSKRTRAAWAVASGCRHRIGLTGTPMQDTPEDLYGVLHLLFPDEYPTKTPYVNRYLEIEWNVWGGRDIKGLHPTRAPEFLANFDTISRRLTKAVVLPFLPKKVCETRWVTLPPKQRKAYEDMRKKMVAELETSTMMAENSLVKAGMLLQLANSAGEVDADGKYRMEAPSPKVDAFIEDAVDGDFDGQQVVVFSDSKELLEVLAPEMDKKKLEYVMITGDVTGDARQEAMDRFQAGEVQFCLLTRAGGEGITLTAASTMVRLVRSWSLTIHKQVEDRTHRIGSERHESVTYIDYIVDDTVEMAQIVRLNAKEGRAQEVLRDEDLLKMLKEPAVSEDLAKILTEIANMEAEEAA